MATLITLLMFPVMVVIYVRLARREEAATLAEFGDRYRAYMQTTQAWSPRWRNASQGA
jgi:protein-S-isoprenylcysteine O-methyltransferase Ste14